MKLLLLLEKNLKMMTVSSYLLTRAMSPIPLCSMISILQTMYPSISACTTDMVLMARLKMVQGQIGCRIELLEHQAIIHGEESDLSLDGWLKQRSWLWEPYQS